MNLDFYLNLTTITRREYSLKKKQKKLKAIFEILKMSYSLSFVKF